jgi:hypothetical protein
VIQAQPALSPEAPVSVTASVVAGSTILSSRAAKAGLAAKAAAMRAPAAASVAS